MSELIPHWRRPNSRGFGSYSQGFGDAGYEAVFNSMRFSPPWWGRDDAGLRAVLAIQMVDTASSDPTAANVSRAKYAMDQANVNPETRQKFLAITQEMRQQNTLPSVFNNSVGNSPTVQNALNTVTGFATQAMNFVTGNQQPTATPQQPVQQLVQTAPKRSIDPKILAIGGVGALVVVMLLLTPQKKAA